MTTASGAIDQLVASMVILTQAIPSSQGGQGNVAIEALDLKLAEMDKPVVPLEKDVAVPFKGASSELSAVLSSVVSSSSPIDLIVPGYESVAYPDGSDDSGGRIVSQAVSPIPASATAVDVGVGRDKVKVASVWDWTACAVFTGMVLSSMNLARSAVRGLGWRKRPCGSQVRSDDKTIEPRRPHADETLISPKGGRPYRKVRRSRSVVMPGGTSHA